MKSIVLTFDDGTVYDRRFIQILDKYGVRATFNLNSGLDDFVWYSEGTPIKRLRLSDGVELYKNHEVASHTLTHPCLVELDRDTLLWEVNTDTKNLTEIFERDIHGFAVPFDKQNEEVISTIRDNSLLSYLRLSAFSDSVHPADPFHIYINAWYDSPDIYEKLEGFINSDDERGMFVIVGHSYDFQLGQKWDVIEKLVEYLSKLKTVAVEPMWDACRRYFEGA